MNRLRATRWFLVVWIALVLALASAAALSPTSRSSVWHPPGESDPNTFACQLTIGSVMQCTAHHIPRPPFPNQWPKWEAYRNDNQCGGPSDKDRGQVAFLDLSPSGRWTIVMKPHPHPATWVSHEYDIKGGIK